MEHTNPINKIIASPVIRQSGFRTQQGTPKQKRSYSIKNTNQITKTKSPQQLAQNFREREMIQDQILRLLEENSKMMGLLTEFDYEIKQKVDQIGVARDQSRYNSPFVRPQRQKRGESPILKQLKIIKTKLNSIDIKKSIENFYD